MDKVGEQIKILEQERDGENFWNDTAHAEVVISKINSLSARYDEWSHLRNATEDAKLMLEMSVQELNADELELERKDSEKQYEVLLQKFQALTIQAQLSGEYDANDCFLSIQTGAGGTESCDWVKMLLRLYTRWSEQRGYKVTTMDLLESEGGVKSVELQIRGEYAYGYLSAESGVHRLVRISPFDSNSRRHTTFASVYATPVIEDDISFEIKPDDIRVDTFRASGAGGQHVNTTDSAVRITHLETAIVVQCQNERSQASNKQSAMKILKSRLYEYYEQKKREAQAAQAASKLNIGWGSQIRSYVFHPYTMVKDHRTDEETGNVQAVMNGEIDNFIEAYLREKASENSKD